jgi:hypothetical protein
MITPIDQNAPRICRRFQQIPATVTGVPELIEPLARACHGLNHVCVSPCAVNVRRPSCTVTRHFLATLRSGLDELIARIVARPTSSIVFSPLSRLKRSGLYLLRQVGAFSSPIAQLGALPPQFPARCYPVRCLRGRESLRNRQRRRTIEYYFDILNLIDIIFVNIDYTQNLISTRSMLVIHKCMPYPGTRRTLSQRLL